MSYTLLIDSNAIQNIQKGIDYYDEQQIGLGVKFEAEIIITPPSPTQSPSRSA